MLETRPLEETPVLAASLSSALFPGVLFLPLSNALIDGHFFVP